jgi:hypothetical protein
VTPPLPSEQPRATSADFKMPAFQLAPLSIVRLSNDAFDHHSLVSFLKPETSTASTTSPQFSVLKLPPITRRPLVLYP